MLYLVVATCTNDGGGFAYTVDANSVGEAEEIVEDHLRDIGHRDCCSVAWTGDADWIRSLLSERASLAK